MASKTTHVKKVAMRVHLLDISPPDLQSRKKRKIELPGDNDVDMHSDTKFSVTTNGTVLRCDGMMTPMDSAAIPIEGRDAKGEITQIDDMDTTEDVCPCGYLHGPGSNMHEDVGAVGLSSTVLLRGPD